MSERSLGSPERPPYPAPQGPGRPESGEPEPVGLGRARTLARLMDSSIPVPFTGRSFGLDALLGLVPGLGDAAGAAIAAYIVGVGVRLGVPKSLLFRLLGNVVVEAVGGTVPGLGDLFDAAWKANVRNVALLEAHVANPDRSRRAGRVLLVTVGAVFLVFLGATVWLSFRLGRWLFGLLPFAGAGGSL